MQLTSTLPAAAAAPWYKHRWPWLLMLGPALVVVAAIITGWLAITRQDAMVVDDYYKRGKAINHDLRRDRAAGALRLSFTAHHDAAAGLLRGELSSFGRPLSVPFRISLAHATQVEKDIVLEVVPDALGRFAVALPALERARYQMLVEGNERTWRLVAPWRLPAQQTVSVVADAEPAK
ncbi:FixH family protein [Massilia glaciei]|uniref:Cytochrome oxidase assembly protein n=1 Tax=Massilia glaciei TaxID=1524097 RepID=A0A2U2I4X1_9BURK|nr:FixH family protein [Massilia glaciei]PWF54793.1 cytochrome oxidase assembly protein [Massilia glaciei]